MAVFPKKLKVGDTIAVVAPANSFAIIDSKNRDIALSRFEKLGYKLKFGNHIEECDENNSSSIESRVEDLHDAFLDQTVSVVSCWTGGYNSNQLLDYLDYDLIKDNPKILIGYSDITALQNAIFARTGLVTYSGPGFGSFAQKEGFEYTQEYFEKCVINSEAFEIKPSESWSDDNWKDDQENRDFVKNEGWLVINEGEAEGTILGGNLGTFHLLQGTKYMPDLHHSVLFLEEYKDMTIQDFDRILQSLLHLEGFNHVKGLVLGRFQKASEVQNNLIIKMIKSKRELNHIPVIANVDFGHTTPLITFPIGGKVSVIARKESVIRILEH